MTRHDNEKCIEALIVLNRLTRYLVRNSLNIWLSSLVKNQIVIQDNSKIVANAKVFLSRLAIYLIDMTSNKNISILLYSVSLLGSTDFFVISHNEKCNNYLKKIFLYVWFRFICKYVEVNKARMSIRNKYQSMRNKTFIKKFFLQISQVFKMSV